MAVCKIKECGAAVHAGGLCNAHYKRSRHGVPLDVPLRRPKRAPSPSDAELIAALRYDPSTGLLSWARDTLTRKAGEVVGRKNVRGYIVVGIRGFEFYAHRLAWLLMTGGWPTLIDHRDQDKANNRWSNLRVATKSQNGANRPAPVNSTTGVKGTYRDKSGHFYAQISVRGRHVHLGKFSTLEEAAAAYQRAALSAHGEFADGASAQRLRAQARREEAVTQAREAA
jgi:hypothetical protein